MTIASPHALLLASGGTLAPCASSPWAAMDSAELHDLVVNAVGPQIAARVHTMLEGPAAVYERIRAVIADARQTFIT